MPTSPCNTGNPAFFLDGQESGSDETNNRLASFCRMDTHAESVEMNSWSRNRRLCFLTLLVLLLSSRLAAPVCAQQPPIRARYGMVASANAIASQVGVDILKRGVLCSRRRRARKANTGATPRA